RLRRLGWRWRAKILSIHTRIDLWRRSVTAGPFPIRPTSPNSECDGHRPPLQFAGMNEIVGIDLGTTNSLIGVMDAGFPILIADKNGARLTPSVVHFSSDGTPLVGQPATRMRALKPAQTIYSIKR